MGIRVERTTSAPEWSIVLQLAIQIVLDRGLKELNELFEVNLTAGKLFVTICVPKLTCYLVLLVLSFRALDTHP